MLIWKQLNYYDQEQTFMLHSPLSLGRYFNASNAWRSDDDIKSEEARLG